MIHMNNSSPIGIEISSVFGPSALECFKALGKRKRSALGDPRALQFLIQKTSVAIQRGDQLAVMGTLNHINFSNGFL